MSLKQPNIVDKALADLCERMIACLSQDDYFSGVIFETNSLRRTFSVGFICEHNWDPCVQFSAKVTEEQIQAFKTLHVYPEISRFAWGVTRLDRESANCTIYDSTSCTTNTKPWTALARTYSDTVLESSYDQPEGCNCFVCYLPLPWSSVMPFCGNEQCKNIVANFVQSSYVYCTVGRLLPRDIARYIGGKLAQIDLADLPW